MRLRAPYKVEQGKCEFIDVRCAHRTPSPIISSNAPLPRLDLSGNLCNKLISFTFFLTKKNHPFLNRSLEPTIMQN